VDGVAEGIIESTDEDGCIPMETDTRSGEKRRDQTRPVLDYDGPWLRLGEGELMD